MRQSEFENMAREVRPGLVRQTFLLTNDGEMAEDVAQDTLLRLWQLRERLEAYRSVGALARVIARNLALDAMRRGGHTVSLEGLPEIDAEAQAAADDAILRSEARARLDRVMAALPASQRMVMMMRHCDGLEIDEIARITCSSASNVRVLLCRARAKVKQQFINR